MAGGKLNEREAKLQQLLMELYASSMLWRSDLSAAEQNRVLDTVLAAAEGRDFSPLGLPFPRSA